MKKKIHQLVDFQTSKEVGTSQLYVVRCDYEMYLGHVATFRSMIQYDRPRILNITT